jgi:hypothetical protein
VSLHSTVFGAKRQSLRDLLVGKAAGHELDDALLSDGEVFDHGLTLEEQARRFPGD